MDIISEDLITLLFDGFSWFLDQVSVDISVLISHDHLSLIISRVEVIFGFKVPAAAILTEDNISVAGRWEEVLLLLGVLLVRNLLLNLVSQGNLVFS